MPAETSRHQSFSETATSQVESPDHSALAEREELVERPQSLSVLSAGRRLDEVIAHRTNSQDLAFLARKGLKNPEERALIEQLAHQDPSLHTYQALLAEFQKAADCPPPLRACIDQLMQLSEVLAPESSTPRKELQTQFSTFMFPIGNSTLSLRNILGAQKYDGLLKKLRASKHTTESLTQWKKEAHVVLFSARTLTAFFYFLLLHQGKVLIDTTASEDLEEFVHNAYFDDLDAFHQISHQLSAIQSIENKSGKFRLQAAATLLREAVQAGQINSTFARELYVDIQYKGLDSLYLQYFHSFTQVLGPEETRQLGIQQGPEDQKKLYKKVAIILLIAVLAGTQQYLPNLPALGSKIGQAVSDVLKDFSLFVGLPGGQIEYSDNGELQPYTLEELDFILKRSAIASLEAGKKPLIQDEMTFPDADGFSNDMQADAVTPEGHREQAASILWEMSNWEVEPSHLLGATYTQINRATMKFQQWLPELTSTGTTIPLIKKENIPTQPNLMIGERSRVGEGWIELPTPSDMAPIAGSVMITETATGVTYYYPVEITQSPITDVFFARFILNQNDRTWLNDHQGTYRVEIAYSFEETTPQPKEPFLTEPETSIIEFTDLPPDLQTEITRLNNDNSLSDVEKMRAFQRWFISHGEYSFNPQDNQKAYIDAAIQAGNIPSAERETSFYKAFFKGWEYEPFQLDAEGPTPMSGECGRRNSSGWVAAQFLEISPEWKFVLNAGQALSGSTAPNRPSQPSPFVRGSQAHLWLGAINSATGETLNLDVTQAPQTDPGTKDVLNNANNLPSGVEPKLSEAPPSSDSSPVLAPPESEKPLPEFQPIEYIPPAEASQYPAILPNWDISFDQLQPRFSQGGTLNTNTKGLHPRSFIPWQVVTKPQVLSGPNLEENSMGTSDFMIWNLPLRATQEGEFTPGVSLSEEPITWLIDTIPPESSRDRVSYAFRLQQTNVIPLFGENSRDRFVDVNSLQVKLGEWSVPARFQQLNNTNETVVVVDIPVKLVNGATVSVSYDSYFNYYNEKEPATILPREDSLINLRKLGFTEAESTSIYFHVAYVFRQNFQYLEQEPLDESLKRHPLTEPISYLSQSPESETLATVFTILRALDLEIDTTIVEKLLIQLDTNDPSFRKYLLANAYFQDTLQKYVPTFPSLETASSAELAQLFIPNSPYSAVYQESNAILSSFASSQIDVKFPYRPLRSQPFITEELASMEVCTQFSTSSAEKYQCYLQAPYINAIAMNEVERSILQAMSTESDYNRTLLRLFIPQEDDKAAQWSTTSSSYSYDLSFLYKSPRGWKENPVYSESEENLSENQRQAALNAEAISTNSWYVRQLLSSLARGNLEAWTRFLTFFMPLAGVSYGLLRGVAQARRWSHRRDFVEYFDRRNIDRKGITDQLVQYLGIPLPEFTKKQLDQAWSTPEATTREQLFLRRWVTKLGLSGRKRLPFNLFERLKPVNNIWQSREVPPTYHEHVFLSTQQLFGLAELLSSDSPEVVEKILQLVLEHGIALDYEQKTLPFSLNRLLMTSPDSWKKRLQEILQQQLATAGVTELYKENLEQVVSELEKPWQLIMQDSHTVSSNERSLTSRAQKLLQRVRR